MQLFYQKDFREKGHLDEVDSKHCAKVLRKSNGDVIWVTDGAGGLFECEIIDHHPKKVKLKVLSEQHQTARAERRVHLVIAPTKNIDRMTYLVEKATEIGIDEISFIQTTNSERKVIKTDRIERVAISAMKQSLKSFLPTINDLQSLGDFIDSVNEAQKYICHLDESSVPLAKENLENDVCFLVGPEGDFTEEELKLAFDAGFKQVSLGESRLRTETAGLVAVTLMNLI
ncbi:16S rRNA (uracil(1498)-N(3))-methyltransferase [Jiulongibacter sp. NS-SX5]|uniref:16S rRNA (uracil(1498)-N(3))-methyltransferase n=1 Tax=Jiulongibacter sp. NS-SX5 TaxID=3463854 RepID=UPI004059DDF2